jgi:hypothetical protein
MDGRVEHSSAAPAEAEDALAAEAPSSAFDDAPLDLGEFDLEPEPVFEEPPQAPPEATMLASQSAVETPPTALEDNIEQALFGPEEGAPAEGVQESEPGPEPPAEFADSGEPAGSSGDIDDAGNPGEFGGGDNFDVFADAQGEAPAEAYSMVPKASDSADLSDIAQFGNSETSGSRDGSLRYNLFISGIDTSDVRMAFREALTDRKFLWDTDQILRSLRNGQVRIENVSATKAHVLISRLRSMPVKIRWEQYAVQQT